MSVSFRRFLASLALTGCIASALLVAQDFVTFKDQPSQDLFVASRAAVGRGDGSVKNLRSLILKGRARLAQDDGTQAESDLVIKVLLPDAYLRTDTFGGKVQTTGFDGNRLLTTITEGGQTSAPPASMTDALLKSERARFTRLILGTTTALSPTLRLIGRSAPGLGSMERPAEGARVGAIYDSANEMRLIEFSGPDGFYARYVVDAAKVPQRLEYRAAKDEIWTTVFSDRRAVGGLLMPYRIVTTGRGTVREDLRFDEILVNPELSKGDFRR
jgi:hypothetical protein